MRRVALTLAALAAACAVPSYYTPRELPERMVTRRIEGDSPARAIRIRLRSGEVIEANRIALAPSDRVLVETRHGEELALRRDEIARVEVEHLSGAGTLLKGIGYTFLALVGLLILAVGGAG